MIDTRRTGGRRPRPRLTALISAGALLAALAATPGAAQDRELRLPGLEGGQLSEGELSRGVSLVVVWASWSPRCRDIVPRLNALVDRWGGRTRVVSVDFQEDRGAVRSFLAGQSLKAPVFLDEEGAFSKKHAISTLPGLLVIRDGQVVYRGKLPDDPDDLISQLLR